MGRRLSAKDKLLVAAGALMLTGAAAFGALEAYWNEAAPLVGMTIN